MANLRDLAYCGALYLIASAAALILGAALMLGAYRLGQAQELQHQISAARAFARAARP